MERHSIRAKSWAHDSEIITCLRVRSLPETVSVSCGPTKKKSSWYHQYLLNRTPEKSNAVTVPKPEEDR